MSKIKIPERLYVTAKFQEETEYWGTPNQRTIKHKVGFLHPYTQDKAGAKRQETQNDWAYGGWSRTDSYYMLGGVMWQKGTERVDDATQKYGYRMDPFERPVDADLQPVVLDNTPMAGFRVLTFVSRCSTSNKVWRIMDPRGYEFEISTASFEEIVMNTTISCGEILAPCVWKANKNLVIA
jgi:hypothetical protein